MGSHPNDNKIESIVGANGYTFKARASFVGVSKNIVTVKFHVAISYSNVQPTYKLGGSWNNWGVKLPWGYNSSNSYQCEGSSSAFYDSDAPGINYAITKSFKLTKPDEQYYVGIGWGSEIVWSATWTDSPEIVTISYNANGGSGAPSSTSKYYGVDTKLSSTKPTRTGYTFKGWSTSKTATSATYAAGANYNGDSSITLYAVWELNSYTISYNANGGSGAPNAQTKYYSVNISLSSTKPTRTGYTFRGWATSATSSTVSYAAGANYTANAAITLYAVWELNTFAVVYNANGGTNAPSNQTKYYGINLILSSTVPTKTGHTFKGWATSADSITIAYNKGSSYTANAAITLYAVWELNTYKISYNANGGTNAPPSQTKYYGADLILSSTIPLKDRHDFLGWSSVPNNPTVDYEPGSVYMENTPTTFYAIWQGNEYSVVYSGDDDCVSIPEPQSKIHNLNLVLSDMIPRKEGHTFIGWGTTKDSNCVKYTPGSIYTSNATLNLFAIFIDNRLLDIDIHLQRKI